MVGFAAGAVLCVLSLAGSIVQGSLSQGDGIIMHVLWGVIASLWPALNEDPTDPTGFRTVTMIIYLRLITTPPYLMWLLLPAKDKSGGGGTRTEANPPLTAITTTTGGDSRPEVQEEEEGSGSGTFPLAAAAAAAPTSSSPFAAFNMPTFIAMAVPAAFWAVAGVFVLRAVDTATIERVFGVACVVFAILYLALRHFKRVMTARRAARKTSEIAEDEDGTSDIERWLLALATPPPYLPPVDASTGASGHRPRRAALAVLSCAAFLMGLMASLGGIGGPPLMLAVLLLELPPPLVRMTFPLGYAAPSYLRIIIAWSVGLLDLSEWRLYVPTTVIGILGLHAGVALGNFLTPNTFGVFMFVLLFLAGLVMLTEAAVVLLPALAVAIVAVVVSQQRDLQHLAADAARTPNLSRVVMTNDINAKRNSSLLFELNKGTPASNTMSEVMELIHAPTPDDIEQLYQSHEQK